MAQSSVTPIRAGTKALPETVFEACRHLAETKGDFRNEDVLAMTGGGMATVARLVKTWRHHQHIIQANDALSAEATITLVEMVDKLVQQQIAQSKAAVDQFLKGGADDLAQLSQTLEARQLELNTANDTVASLRDQIVQRDQQLVQLTTRLGDRDRELADAQARAERITDELTQTQAAHAAKLELAGIQHQQQLAQALEAQRRTMDSEKHAALEKHDRAWTARLAEARGDIDRAKNTSEALQTELQTANTQTHDQQRRTAALEHEMATLKQLHQHQLESQKAIVEEKHHALLEAQAAQRQLMGTIEQQLTHNQEDFEQRVRALAGAATGVTTALSDISTLLTEIKSSLPPKG